MNSEDISWQLFFAPGERVIALPCWRKPRLYIVSKHWKQRWKDSEFYPAFKPRAKLFKLAVRILAACDFLPAKKAVAGPKVCSLKSAVSFSRLAVLVGVDGPTQKLIARCLDSDGRPVAYIKYGEKPLACEKIGNEADVLNRMASAPIGHDDISLPETAPQLLWRGELGRGVALMISAVEGEMLDARLSASADSCQLMAVKEYLERLRISDVTFDIDDHPAIVRLRKQVAGVGDQRAGVCRQSSVISLQDFFEILAPLRAQKWPVVIQHGDFTPWNTIRISESSVKSNVLGVTKEANLHPNNFEPKTFSALKLKTGDGTSLRLCAIDWEEGTAEGFPYFDLVYYVLQSAFLIHHWSPAQAVPYALKLLVSDGLDEQQALAVIKLAALDACFRFESRTGAKAEALRQFRLNIINC